MKYFYSIYHTRTFLSNILYTFIFNPLSYLVWLGVIILSIITGYVSGNYFLAIIIIITSIYIYSVAYLFIVLKLRSDSDDFILVNNYAEILDYDTAQYLVRYFAQNLTYNQLLEAISKSKRGKTILSYMGLDSYTFYNKMKDLNLDQDNTLTPINEFLERVNNTRISWEEKRIGSHTILYVLFEQNGVFQTLLDQLDLSKEDFFQIIAWESLHYNNTIKVPDWSPDGIYKNFGSLGRAWTIGYTNDLDRITEDITESIIHRDPNRVIIHQDILKRVLTNLSNSNRHNILLLGEVGVGKRSLINNLAFTIRKYQIEKNINLSRVLKLNTTDLISGTPDAAKYLLNALNYAEKSGNIILVIENISELFLSASDEIRNIIVKFLNSRIINVIGLDNPEGYHTGVKSFPVIDSLFESITIENTSEEDTMYVLMMTSFDLTRNYNKYITYQSLRAVINFSERYISKGGFPGKAVEILSDAMNQANADNSPFVLESHIRAVVSERTNININTLNNTEKDILLSLEEKLKAEIKGQPEGLTAIVNALKRAQLDVKNRDKPIGTFLFLGPTGVGKTETAKALAKHYFGSSDRMIRLDMNEFGSEDSVYGILGSPAGEDNVFQEGFLTKRIQDKPFSLILLDEIEKAHKQVLNLFLQILDEGVLTDNRGIKTDFRNSIIIATSNAGALFLRDFLKSHSEFDKVKFKQELLDNIIKGKEFAPEFINRFTDVIVYYPLEISTVSEIASKILDNMITNFNTEKGIKLEITQDAIDYLAQQGYSQDFGARELERTISSILETYLANYMLINTVKRGDKIVVKLNDILSKN
jgi:ATP-dependent Clp protease ATP-binding subunit ClpA